MIEYNPHLSNPNHSDGSDDDDDDLKGNEDNEIDDDKEDDTDYSSVCQSPNWRGDGYCDDENNTEMCGFDGGDCCDKKKPKWDNFCEVSKICNQERMRTKTILFGSQVFAFSVIKVISP